MTISLRLSNEGAALMKNYVQMSGITMSELARQCVLERSEDSRLIPHVSCAAYA